MDPSGYKYGPTPLERERRDGEGAYYNYELAWKMAGYAGSQFGSYMSRHASGGWEFSSPTGGYVNQFTGERMSAAQFDGQYLNPAYNPISIDYNWGVVASFEVEGYDLPINVFGRTRSNLTLNREREKVSILRVLVDYTFMLPYDFYGAAYDFTKNYHDMRKLNLKNSDKYFHSKANFQATRRGPGGAFFAIHFSNLREIFDQRIKNDTRLDALQDQEANLYGRIQGWDYRYYPGEIDFNEVLPKYRKDYFPIGY